MAVATGEAPKLRPTRITPMQKKADTGLDIEGVPGAEVPYFDSGTDKDLEAEVDALLAEVDAEKPVAPEPVAMPQRNIEGMPETKLNAVELVHRTQNIDELCATVTMLQTIEENGVRIPARDAVNAIRATEEYLHAHFNELITGVITGRNEDLKQALGSIESHIPIGGDIKLRQKARQLMVAEMQQAFEQHRSEYVTQAISECATFDQLDGVLKQFRKIQGVEKIFAPAEVMSAIGKMRHDIAVLATDPSWRKNKLDAVRVEILQMVSSHHIPADSGIDQKVTALLLEEAHQKRLEAEAATLNQGVISRWTGRIGRLFGRR